MRCSAFALCVVLLVGMTSRADDASDARALSDKAMTAINAKDLKGAAALLRKAVKLQPDNDIYVGQLGYVELALGNPRAALQHNEKAIALNPKGHSYHANAACAAQHLNEHDKALAHAEKALTFGRTTLGDQTFATMQSVRNRAKSGPFVDKANAAEKDGRFDDAVEQMKKAVAAAPDDAYNRAKLGWLESRAGRFADGLANLEKAIAPQ